MSFGVVLESGGAQQLKGTREMGGGDAVMVPASDADIGAAADDESGTANDERTGGQIVGSEEQQQLQRRQRRPQLWTYEELRALADHGLSVTVTIVRRAPQGGGGGSSSHSGQNNGDVVAGADWPPLLRGWRRLAEDEEEVSKDAQELICEALDGADADTCRAMAQLCGTRGAMIAIFAILIGVLAFASMLIALIVVRGRF